MMNDKIFAARFGWLIRQEMEAIWKWNAPELTSGLSAQFIDVFEDIAHSVFTVAVGEVPDAPNAVGLSDQLDEHDARYFTRLVLATIKVSVENGVTIKGSHVATKNSGGEGDESG
jgi:hypothetical protein